jgi:hypothetical protein
MNLILTCYHRHCHRRCHHCHHHHLLLLPVRCQAMWPVMFTCHLINRMKTNIPWVYVKAKKQTKQTSWPESASELCRPSDRRLPAKLVPTFADRGCHVVSVTDLCGHILGFLGRSRYFLFQAAPQLHPWSRADPVPETQHFLRKSSSAGIEPGPPDMQPGTPTTRPQRRSTPPPLYITYINSVCTPQEAQHISVQQPGTLTTRPQRRSTLFYITYINSVRTSFMWKHRKKVHSVSSSQNLFHTYLDTWIRLNSALCQSCENCETWFQHWQTWATLPRSWSGRWLNTCSRASEGKLLHLNSQSSKSCIRQYLHNSDILSSSWQNVSFSTEIVNKLQIQ